VLFLCVQEPLGITAICVATVLQTKLRSNKTTQ